jgi:anti-sigma-K factor RskA
MANPTGTPSRRLTLVVLLAWLAALAAPPVVLARWRSTRLVELADPAVQAQWTEFRDAMRSQTDRSGPVQRKVPKSVEPPELVWLRDYFWLAVAAWVVLGGVLTLLISDVPGDRPIDIASGPTVADPSTCADALAVLERYRIAVPLAARQLLESG